MRPMVQRWTVVAACLALMGSVASAEDRQTVNFAINYNTVFGQSVYVVGDIPELGNNDPAFSVKLEPGSFPLWQASIAIPKGTVFSYSYIWRDDSVPQWSNSANTNPVSGPFVTSTGLADPRPSRKGLYYHSGWAEVTLNWRVGGGAFTPSAMSPFGAGRVPGEQRWRALGVGVGQKQMEFFFTDDAGGRDPVVGTYATALDAFFVQDGQVFDYAPPPVVGPPQQINVTSFFSTVLGENRPYRVLMPRGYNENTAKRYPVLYMHDGQNVFDLGPFGTWNADETAASMIGGGAMREIIIVGVDNTANRFNNYVTPDDGGQADQYADFLINELKPVIDAAYRTYTDRDHTATIGSSLGGVVALYLGWDFNAVFGRVGPMSGSWWLGNFPNRVALGPQRNLRIYLDSGDSGSSNDGAWGTMNLRDRLLRLGYVLQADLEHVVGYGDVHNEAAWASRLPGAYAFLFPATESENPLIGAVFTGDLDQDGDMDVDDHALLADCIAGPGQPIDPACLAPVSADLNGDGSIDMADWAVFQVYFSGAR